MSAAGKVIKGVLLDKDGTLIDFDATWHAVALRMALEAAGGESAMAASLLERAGFDVAAGRFRADSVFAAGTNADIVDMWHPELGREARRERISHFDKVTASEGASQAVAVAGVIKAIGSMRQSGMRLGVATNDSTEGAERTLISLGIAQMFDAVFGYDAVANPKPAGDVIIAFADMAGLKVSQVAMVGDNRHDLEAGRAAGAGLVVGVLSGTGDRRSLEQLADVVLGSVADLPGYLATGQVKAETAI
ncbi:MAG: HAD family hydrolase [Rhizobiaceae bacterium]